jgi:hypothetical protein
MLPRIDHDIDGVSAGVIESGIGSSVCFGKERRP